VARKRAADARQRIQEAILVLEGINNTSDLVKIESIDHLTVAGFLAWVRLGNDTLYKTNVDLLYYVKRELERVRNLRRASSGNSSQIAKKKNRFKRMEEKISELEALLAARNLDCLSLIRELESVRRTNRELKIRLGLNDGDALRPA